MRLPSTAATSLLPYLLHPATVEGRIPISLDYEIVPPSKAYASAALISVLAHHHQKPVLANQTTLQALVQPRLLHWHGGSGLFRVAADQVEGVLGFEHDAVQERHRNYFRVEPQQGAHLRTVIGRSQVLQR
jgi:hypothetical protein